MHRFQQNNDDATFLKEHSFFNILVLREKKSLLDTSSSHMGDIHGPKSYNARKRARLAIHVGSRETLDVFTQQHPCHNTREKEQQVSLFQLILTLINGRD
jgi:hypothetical protein